MYTVIVLWWLRIVCCQTYSFQNFIWIFREWWDPQVYFLYTCTPKNVFVFLGTADTIHLWPHSWHVTKCIWSVPCLLLYTHVNITRNCMYLSPLWDHTTLHLPMVHTCGRNPVVYYKHIIMFYYWASTEGAAHRTSDTHATTKSVWS